MSSEPLVSVIIPTFNRRQFLAEALASVLSQTHGNLEIIVADDGSDDDTGEYVRNLRSDHITYLSLEHHGRPAPARNAALARATGEFVAFLDSDDQWMPSKTETQLRAFAGEPDLALVATNLLQFPPRSSKPVLRLDKPLTITFRDLLRHNLIANSSVMLRRSVVKEVGWLDESPELRGLEDYEYWLRIVREGRAVILSDPLLLYRKHEGNIGIQDLDQLARLRLIIERHRDSDPAEIDAALEELEERKHFRRAIHDLDEGTTTVSRVLMRPRLGLLDRLRVARYGFKAGRWIRRG